MTDAETIAEAEAPASIKVLEIEHRGGNDYALWIDRDGGKHETLMVRVREHCRDGTKGLKPEDWPLFEAAQVDQVKAPKAAPVHPSIAEGTRINELLAKARKEAKEAPQVKRVHHDVTILTGVYEDSNGAPVVDILRDGVEENWDIHNLAQEVIKFDDEYNSSIVEQVHKLSLNYDVAKLGGARAGQDAEVSREAIEKILAEGQEWAIILTGLHHKVVGEDNLLKALTLSGLSSVLPEGRRFSTYTNASSQMGKSYSAEATAEMLFSDRTIWQQSFSPKSFYYEARENPNWMYGKVMVLDELADLSDESRNILKPIISWTHGELHHLTIDEKKQALDLVISSAPVIWANSAKPTEDNGLQLSNRFLKMGIDESKAQTDAINQTRCKNAQFGRFRPRGKVLEAKAVVQTVMKFRPVEILVPLAPCVTIEGEARNILDLFLSVVSSCAYLHHARRYKIQADVGEVLIASASDVLEASELWNSFTAQRNAGLSYRHLKVVEAISRWYLNNPTLAEVETPLHPTVDDITDQYNAIEGNATKTSKTIQNTILELVERDLVNARKPEGERFYVYEIPRGKEDVPQISVNLAGAVALYDSWVGDMKDLGFTIEDEARGKVLDVDISGLNREMTLPEIVHDLRELGEDGFNRGTVEALRDDPDRGKILFEELLSKGIIVKKPRFKDRYTCPPVPVKPKN